MRRWLPFPLLTASLLAVWLLLNESLTLGAVMLGSVFSLAGAWAFALLDPPKMKFGRPRAALRLALVVLVEIVRSNNAVARIILRPRSEGRRTSGFVHIPLDMHNPYGLTALACIVTATPGTLWAEYDSTRSTMLLHVLDLIDEEEWVRTIKERYEARLMEIFQ